MATPGVSTSPYACRRRRRALDSRCGENDGRGMKGDLDSGCGGNDGRGVKGDLDSGCGGNDGRGMKGDLDSGCGGNDGGRGGWMKGHPDETASSITLDARFGHHFRIRLAWESVGCRGRWSGS